MYPTFTKNEAMSIVSLIIDVAACDSNFHVNEQKYALIVANRLGLSENEIQRAQTLTPQFVSDTLSSMTFEKRKLTTAIVSTVAIVDGQISNAERRILDYIGPNCGFTSLGNDRPDVIASNWIENR